jgi:site-specific DNA-methyltransferase (adenine-specific)
MEVNKIYNEDCLVGMQRIADNSIDVIITDPPYGCTACKWDTVTDLQAMWTQLWRVLKPNGIIVMFCDFRFGVKLVTTCPNPIMVQV